MRSLEEHAQEKLAALRASGLSRQVRSTERRGPGRVEREGRSLISLSCNDYLGLSQDPRVIAAAAQAARDHGTGAGAARLVTGGHPLATALERALAEFLDAPAVRLFGSGYLANAGVIPSLVGPGDRVILDRRSHASLYAGARASGAELLTFDPRQPGALEAALKGRAAVTHCLIAVEGVHSMDGDRAPVADYAALAQAHDAWLLVDDAHAFGVLEAGRGTCHQEGARLPVPLQIGTCSKALGSYGGFLAASQSVIELLTSRARSFVYTTGLPPPVLAASLAALELIAQEPARTARPLEAATLFCRALGLPDPESPIVPLLCGGPEAALSAQAALEDQGFLAVAIRPPTVPEGTARLRLAFSSALSDPELERLVAAVRRLELPWPLG